MSFLISRTLNIFLLTLLIAAAGCAGPGVYHRVGKGETFWRICKTYGADMQEVAELNNIRDQTEIKAGSRLFIPGASHLLKIKPYSPPQQHDGAKADGEGEGKITIERDRFSWPVRGEIISPFGMRSGVKHGGVDIKAPEGAPVKAAGPGEVVYLNSDMRGYGNIIILKHSDDFYTVYAHNQENLVNMGEKVEKGLKIATVGKTGNASTPHLHFEVRLGKTVRNPLFFLP